MTRVLPINFTTNSSGWCYFLNASDIRDCVADKELNNKSAYRYVRWSGLEASNMNGVCGAPSEALDNHRLDGSRSLLSVLYRKLNKRL